jgi:hypothetical protein
VTLDQYYGCGGCVVYHSRNAPSLMLSAVMPSPEADYAYYLYGNWTSAAEGPFVGARMLLMTVNHPTPFFDDSYAVNSASMGPYGDAIIKELVRGLGWWW